MHPTSRAHSLCFPLAHRCLLLHMGNVLSTSSQQVTCTALCLYSTGVFLVSFVVSFLAILVRGTPRGASPPLAESPSALTGGGAQERWACFQLRSPQITLLFPTLMLNRCCLPTAAAFLVSSSKQFHNTSMHHTLTTCGTEFPHPGV